MDEYESLYTLALPPLILTTPICIEFVVVLSVIMICPAERVYIYPKTEACKYERPRHNWSDTYGIFVNFLRRKLNLSNMKLIGWSSPQNTVTINTIVSRDCEKGLCNSEDLGKRFLLVAFRKQLSLRNSK